MKLLRLVTSSREIKCRRSFNSRPSLIDTNTSTAHPRKLLRHFSTTTTNNNNNNNTNIKNNRPDPFARRPTAKCDPYGQGGKPLPIWEANTLRATIDPQWQIVEGEELSSENEDSSSIPQGLVREFIHPDFVAGSKFVTKVAAVAQLNMHFPSIQLERRILSRQKAWQVVTRIHCHTLVLGGLSTHDFHLAMLIDVEAARKEVKDLILNEQDNENPSLRT